MTIVPDSMIFFFLIILGASFGSFLNVVIYRVPGKMSLIKPTSHCNSCKTPIKPFDNIPILSYFILRGKCRQCGDSFSSRYALVEGLTAGLTVWLFIIYGINEKFFMYLILTYLLIAITFVDIDHFIIPNGFVLFGLAVLIVGLPMDWLPIDWKMGCPGHLFLQGFYLLLD
jgi:leader peptidase (prepilin peptidase)/N-methyltransferase